MNQPSLQNVFLRLGATLYTPATRSPQELISIANREKYPQLRSWVICLEDAVNLSDLGIAMQNLREALPHFENNELLRFIRVRNPEIMSQVLQMNKIEAMKGFVLPKVTSNNLANYLGQLSTGDHFLIMPILETAEAFSMSELEALRKILSFDIYRRRIVCVRVGGNDFLALLNVRRQKGRTIYQTFMDRVIAQIAMAFVPYGFGVSAPVFERMDDENTLRAEIISDLDRGLFGKTAIHPSQIPIIEGLYQIKPEELDDALAILDPNKPAVFKQNGSMIEKTVHEGWARLIIDRYQIYGICGEENGLTRQLEMRLADQNIL